MARRVSLEIVGDSSSLEKAFANAANSAKRFNQQIGQSTRQVGGLKQQAADVRGIAREEQNLIKVRSRRASSLGPFRLAGVGLGAGAGLFAATQAVRELGGSLETTGEEAFKTEGRLKNMVAALTSGNLVGAVKALTAVPKTIEEMGVQLYQIKQREDALREVADGLTTSVGDQSGAFSQATFTTTMSAAALERYRAVVEEAGTSSQEAAKIQLEYKEAADTARVATDALEGSVARLGQAFVTQSGAIVTWKGHVDDLDRLRGPGGILQGEPSRKFAQPAAFLSPSQRREFDLIGQAGMDRIPELQDRLRQLQNQLKRGTSTNEQRLRISTKIRETEAEIAAIYADQAAKVKAAAAARKAAAEAAAEEARRRREEARQAEVARELRILEGPIPTRANLIKQFEQIKARAAKDKDFPKKLTERFAAVARLLREEIMPETREAIQAFFETVRGEFDKGGDTDPLAGLKQVSTKRLTEILGAGVGGNRRRLAFNISGQGIQLYNSVQVDGREIARAATTGQTRSGKRTANQTSGRRG